MPAAAKTYGMFLDGKWTKAGKATLESRNPATGELLARFTQGSADDVDRAVESARKAFATWSRTPPPRRAQILLEAARVFRARKKELGKLVAQEMGKVLAEAEGDVQEAVDFFEYISGEGRRMFGETSTSELPNKFAMWVRRPKGAVGIITPWNFPVAIPSWKIGAALVAGCTVVFKPASTTPLCAARFVEVLHEAGLPPGVVNFVTGPGSTVGNAIVEHPGLAHVSFTGGVPTGREVLTRAGATLKSVHLELGGKNAMIVMDDANLDLALEGLLFGAFGTAGQRCTATSRLLLHDGVYDEFLNRLVKRAEQLRLGDPTDPRTDVGPVHHASQLEKVLEYVDVGRKEGAKVLAGGKRANLKGKLAKGTFVEPTVLEARHGMRVTKEEIFGPVLSVVRIRDFDEAVEISNDVEYGLSSSVYTRDVNRAFQAMERLEAGITYVNAPTIGAEVHLPFGGVKNTGNGGREAGTAAIEGFTEMKTLYVDYSNRLQKAQIDTEKVWRKEGA